MMRLCFGRFTKGLYKLQKYKANLHIWHNFFMNPFNNYIHLIEKIDQKCQKIQKHYREVIRCQKGCSECCQHISIFPVEAAFIAHAFRKLPNFTSEFIINRLDNVQDCPLLVDGICILYESRPIICRTHGFPLLMNRNHETLIDFCPHNFQGISWFQKNAVIDMEQVNTVLSMINRVFISQMGIEPLPERLSIRDAICKQFPDSYVSKSISEPILF